MKPETIKTVIEIWLHCHVDKQNALLRKYLDLMHRGVAQDWIHFLIDEFEISEALRPV